MYKFLFIAILLITPHFGGAQTVHQVTPRAIDRTVLARDIFTESVVVSNPYAYKLRLYASVNELVVNEQGDIVDYVPSVMADRTSTVTSWIELSQAAILLEPGASTTLTVRIVIPHDVEPGEYHAFLGFGTGRNRPIAEASVLTGVAPGTLLRIEIKEEMIAQSDLDVFAVSRFVLDSSQKAVSYTIINTTHKPIAPSGEVIVYNSRGAEIGTVAINPAGVVVQPGDTVAFTENIDALQITGRYQAKLALSNESQTASVYDAATFYYLPWWQLLILLSLFLLLGHWLYRRLEVSQTPRYDVIDLEGALPLHVYHGESAPTKHDINLKS